MSSNLPTMFRVCLALAFAAPASLPAQARPMRVLDVFALESQLTPRVPEPIEWLDDDRYLVFDSGFFRVDAVTGKREPFVDPNAYLDAFADLPGLDRADLAKALSSASAHEWNEERSAFVTNYKNDLLHYDLASGEARRLTETPGDEVGEQFSPDGSLVAFVHDFDLWVVDVDGGRPRALTDGGHADLFFGRLDWVYQEELYGRGNFQGYWWSPDSKRIALLRLDESPVEEFTLVSDTPVRPTIEVTNYPKAGRPNPKVDIGVIDVFGGEPRWFDLSRYGTADTLIVRVTWHPSGDEVFFQVQDREQTWLEMLAGDASTGELRLVFREESPCWIEAGPEPLWLDDGKRFVWLSERDGYKHAYVYASKASAELANDGRRVTTGPFEVDEVLSIDEAAGRMWFLSDKDDWKQRNLWSVSLSGGREPRRWTTRDGWHDVKLSPGHRRALDEYSALDQAKELRVLDLATSSGDSESGLRAVRTIVTSRMELLGAFGLETPSFVEIPARDGFVMEGLVYRPRGFDAATAAWPTLFFIYAGPHSPRVLNRWRFRDHLWHHLLAQRGYQVVVVDPRSGSGKGRVSAQACYRTMGQSELRDLEDAVDWTVANLQVDPARVGIWGWSYGGYQTAYNLTHSKKWKLGIAVNPVTDWALYDTIYTERYMGLPQTNADGYAAGSVSNAAADLHGDLLLVHATMDDNVHMQNSLTFAHALQKAGKSFRFMAYPRVRHGIADLEQQVHLFRMMTEFVEEKL